MALSYVDDLIDEDEIPELTEEDFSAIRTLFEATRRRDKSSCFARSWPARNFRPDPVKKPVTVALSTDILDRFTATGEGWEARVDTALRQWLEEHPLPKAS